MGRFWGLIAEGVCGVFRPWVHGRELELQGNRPNRQITADGESNNADMSRSWVGTTWPISDFFFTADRGVSGCRPVETVGAPNAVESEYQQTKAGAIGRRGLSAVMGGRVCPVVVLDAAAWGGWLWEPGMGM